MKGFSNNSFHSLTSRFPFKVKLFIYLNSFYEFIDLIYAGYKQTSLYFSETYKDHVYIIIYKQSNLFF